MATCLSRALLIAAFASGVLAERAGEASGQEIAKTARGVYKPDWSSLEKRPLPAWFNEAKFGIFVVWGPYCVPAWKDRGYAEWYGNRMKQPGSATAKFHRRVYGKDFRYEDFVPRFKAELWDPDYWCELFARSGAKYVVTTANYHDGFAMYPTRYARFNETDRWNSLERGPKRDIIGELKTAGEKRGLKMGIYYSLYEWYHPLWKNADTRDRYVVEHLHPKFKEVVTKYKPWFIFLDGEWAADYRFWQSEKLAAWLYNESPCRDYVITNDRWGQCRGVHGDVFESEYGGGDSCSPEHPWQEDRGMGHSYGYNRAERIEDYDSAAAMIQMLVRCTANGGNYLLCVGPTADGRIPVIMQERLLQVGDWLKVHGEAIYGANASPFWPRRFDWGYVSAKPGKLFLFTFDPGATKIELTGLRNRVKAATILAHRGATGLEFAQDGDRLSLHWPSHLNNPSATVIALDVGGKPNVDKTQQQFADGTVFLGCRMLDIHGTNARVYYRGFGERVRIIDWTDPEETVSGNFDLRKPGRYNLRLTYAASPGVPASEFRGAQRAAAGSRFVIEVNGQKIEHQSISTGGAERFKTVTVAQVAFDRTGRYTIKIRPIAKDWSGLGLQSIELVPLRP